jgi:formate/nitrite transporter FocA (FNT family)
MDNKERESEQIQAEERSAPSGAIVYKAILKEGTDELRRPSSALFWSGLAAGLSMGFSLIAEGLLRTYLPEAGWQPLLAKMGYSVGFLIVILGRQQLFTENTLTPILPLLMRKDAKTFANVARLWGIVLGANLLGGLLVGWVCVKSSAFEPEVQSTFVEIGRETIHYGFAQTVLRGIFAGWLLALMVWLLPFAESGRIWVIIIVTYLVGLGHFSHVVAGSINAFALAAAGAASWAKVLGVFVLAALLGNTLGGVTLVAALNHAQVVSGKKSEDV